jgi:hypothetical protein
MATPDATPDAKRPQKEYLYVLESFDTKEKAVKWAEDHRLSCSSSYKRDDG